MNCFIKKKKKIRKRPVFSVAAVAGIAYAVYRFFTPDYLEDFEDDFDDDFDDDFFEEEEETPKKAVEKDDEKEA